jgi:hypothetical protein
MRHTLISFDQVMSALTGFFAETATRAMSSGQAKRG